MPKEVGERRDQTREKSEKVCVRGRVHKKDPFLHSVLIEAEHGGGRTVAKRGGGVGCWWWGGGWGGGGGGGGVWVWGGCCCREKKTRISGLVSSEHMWAKRTAGKPPSCPVYNKAEKKVVVKPCPMRLLNTHTTKKPGTTLQKKHLGGV